MTVHKLTGTCALDFETYYDSNKENPCTVRKLGNWLYTQHPLFEAYMVSVVSEDGFEWCGEPKNFDWSYLEGKRLIAHNAGFELSVLEYLREKGILPKHVQWAELQDTADMCAYLNGPRALEGAAAHFLNVKHDKGIRDKVKGKKWDTLTPEFQEQLRQYCLEDSRLELRLWLEHSAKWPKNEQQLSSETRRMTWAGLLPDIAGTDAAIESIRDQLAEVRKLIPWPDPPLSPTSVKQECAKHKIEAPKSMAKDNSEFENWLDKHGEKYPWAAAMGQYRSKNALYKKLLTMRARTDDKGVFHYGLKYWGGHLGRDSGDAGFNVQNMSRKPMHGIYLRNLAIKAPPGKVLGIVDESQIEPRVLAWISGDQEKLDLMKKGMDVYEIQARMDGEYDDPRVLKGNPDAGDTRQYNKVKVLACGYGAGPPKVQFIAKKEVGLILTDAQAVQITSVFRRRKFIPSLWNRLERDMRKSRGGDYEMELPSGRIVLYRDVKSVGQLSAVVVKHGRPLRLMWWGGSLTENAVQAIARDIFMYHVLRIRNELGLQILLRSHDEAVTLLNEETAEQDLKNQIEIMSTPPSWMEDFPAAAEGGLTPVYTKL